MQPLGEDQIEFLSWLAANSRNCDEIKGKLNGYRRQGLIRRGFAEWIRPPGRSWAKAVGIQITDAGRSELLLRGISAENIHPETKTGPAVGNEFPTDSGE